MSFRGVKKLYPHYVGRRVVTEGRRLSVIDKHTNAPVSEVVAAPASTIKEAFSLAAKSLPQMRNMPSWQKKEILLQVASGLQERKEELAQLLAIEAGKPVKDGRVEIDRATDVCTVSAEEAVRIHGDFLSLDISKRNNGFSAITSRFPVGVVSMIVPFNFPVNLAMHKIGPAIAAGCPFVLKPSDRTPMSSAILGEILSKTAMPDGSFSILPCLNEDAEHFSTDDNISLISFTGSVPVGWHIKSIAKKKKVVLELGGNAGCVIDQGANVDKAVERLIFGAFYYSGQSCISVQRIFAHDSLYDSFISKFTKAAGALKAGDPKDENTFIGPMISENDAKRLEKWTSEAVSKGAKVLLGGKRNGVFFEPTIMENVPMTAALSCKEAFGPVCTVEKFSDYRKVIDKVNDTPFGLQAGVFTQDIHKAFYAFKNIHAGGVVINDVPSVRVDSQPYGGIKDSGLGREGVRYAIEEMMELKSLILKDIGESF